MWRFGSALHTGQPFYADPVHLSRWIRVAVILASEGVLVIACAPGVAEPRVPDGQGWVVSALQSDDLQYGPFDGGHPQIASGSIVVELADGTVAVIDSDTHLDGICQELAPPPLVTMPCWLQVGLTDTGGRAEWASPFLPLGESGQPETWNQDHDRYYAVIAGHEILRKVTADAMIFANGLVLTLGDSFPMITRCDGDDLDSLIGGYVFGILNIESGEVVTVGCTAQV